MKKKSKEPTAANGKDDLEIPTTPSGFFKKAVMGKYYAQVMSGSNVVRIAPDLVKDFPNEEVVNQALRLVKELRQVGRAKRKKTA